MIVLYYTNVYLNKDSQPGVKKKIAAQIKVFKANNISVLQARPLNEEEFAILDSKDYVITKVSTKDLHGPFYDKIVNRFVLSYLKEHNIDFMYVRNGNFSLQMFAFFKNVRKIGCRILMEIPTYPLTQRITNLQQSLRLKHYKLALSQIFHMTIGSLGIIFFRYCIERIITFNGFDKIWGIPTIKISNAVDVASIPSHHPPIVSNNHINLIAVANVAKWHGYDRIIKSMRKYYDSKPTVIITFDIIGPGYEIEELTKLVDKLDLKEYVYFRGTILGDILNEYFDKAHIAVSVLGCHRDGMTIYDSLKSREYSARCIPFITTCAERDYIDKEFVYSVPNDESLIDLNNVISFYSNLDVNTYEQMRQFALQQCDWSNVFKPVCEFIKNNPV